LAPDWDVALETNGTAQKVAGKPFEITAADGSTIAVPPGDYYFNTKARARRMMMNSLSSEARQVYACLELATMGFQRELAVKMVSNQRVPLTPSDIGTQTGLTNQNVRLALIELEQQGLAERKPIDENRPLQKGNVQIYSWATPRELKCKEHDSALTLSSILQIPDWFPDSWSPLAAFIKRQKLSVVIDQTTCEELLVEGEAIARHYQAAEIVVSQFLERVCAPHSIYKEERTERKIERTVSQSVSSVVVIPTEDRPTDNSSSDTQTAEESLPPPPEAPATRTVVIDPLHKAVYSAIPVELFVKLQDLPSPHLLTQMYLNLAGAPPEHLTHKIRQRWDAITSMGLLASLAKDVGDTFKRLEEKRVQPPPPPDIAAYLEIPDDPVVKETVCLKCRGKTLEYQSGFISWCKCESENRGGGNG